PSLFPSDGRRPPGSRCKPLRERATTSSSCPPLRRPLPTLAPRQAARPPPPGADLAEDTARAGRPAPLKSMEHAGKEPARRSEGPDADDLHNRPNHMNARHIRPQLGLESNAYAVAPEIGGQPADQLVGCTVVAAPGPDTPLEPF